MHSKFLKNSEEEISDEMYASDIECDIWHPPPEKIKMKFYS